MPQVIGIITGLIVASVILLGVAAFAPGTLIFCVP